MTIKSICLISGLAFAAAVPASAQSNDAAYCSALIKDGGAEQNAPARIAIDKCKANDYSGIPVLEQELRNAKLELPSRG
jgi:hypothetical protein